MATPSRSTTGGGPWRFHAPPPLLIGGIIALAAVLVLGTVLIGGVPWQRSGAPTPVPTTGATAVTRPTAVPSTAPTSAPTSVPTSVPNAPVALPGFGAAPVSGGAAVSGAPVEIVTVRAAAHDGYDRFVIDLGTSPMPQYEVRTQTSPTFTLDASGAPVTLQGSRGVEIVLHGAAAHPTYTGSRDLLLGLPALREARVTGDFEGVVHWALGVNGPGFVRVETLTGSTRLVVDVQT